MYKCIYYNF
jgi:hypothetical protein